MINDYLRTTAAISLFFSVSILVSCEEKEDFLTKQQRTFLHGRWILFQGSRNGNPTETLEGVYFQFDSTGKMQTNLPIGAEKTVPCLYKANEVIQVFSENNKVAYQIKSVTDSSLILSTFHRGVQLDMQMQRDTLFKSK